MKYKNPCLFHLKKIRDIAFLLNATVISLIINHFSKNYLKNLNLTFYLLTVLLFNLVSCFTELVEASDLDKVFSLY